jgi:predicted ATP-grasp superfamily ATP-dependent carboligase
MAKKILVTDAGRGSALAIIRSLGRQGWYVVAGDSEPDAFGFYSRYTSQRFVYPPPSEDPQVFVDTIYRFVQDNQIDLIIPVIDEIILPLSKARERFAGLCQLAIASPEALDIVTDKMKTLDLAQEHDVPIPKTYLLSTVDEAKAIVDNLKWPVVLKPRRSNVYKPDKEFERFIVSYAGDPDDFLKQMRELDGRCDVLLQEYHSGEGHAVNLLLYEGQPLCVFQHERLREVPITGGVSSLRQSVNLDHTLFDYAVNMLQSLRWTGLAMVEFKLTAEGPKLMEINGRVWGSLPLATRSGMDFPAYLADLYLSDTHNIPSQPYADYKVGVKVRNLRAEYVWFFQVLLGRKRRLYLKTPSRAELLPFALSFLNPYYKADVQTWDDPIPGLIEILQGATRAIKMITGRSV